MSITPNGFVPEVEQQLLGALLAGGDQAKVFAMLTAESFVEPVHGEFELIARARDSYASTSIPIVARLATPELLEQFQKATGTPLAAYLARCLSETIYSSGTAVRAARGVLEQWARISLGREAAVLAEAAGDPHADAAELMRSAGKAFDDIGSALRVGARTKTQLRFGEAVSEAMFDAREAKQFGGITGITTGLIDLNRKLGGLQRRDLILIAARPSMGKTIVGTSLAARRLPDRCRGRLPVTGDGQQEAGGAHDLGYRPCGRRRRSVPIGDQRHRQ